MEHLFKAELYVRSKHFGYAVDLIDRDKLDDTTEVYVFSCRKGISKFKSTVTVHKDGKIEEVIS